MINVSSPIQLDDTKTTWTKWATSISTRIWGYGNECLLQYYWFQWRGRLSQSSESWYVNPITIGAMLTKSTLAKL